MRRAGQMFPVKEDGVAVHWSDFFPPSVLAA